MNDIPEAIQRPAHGGFPEPTGQVMTAQEVTTTATPYLFPHDVAKIYHDAYRALAIQSGDLSVPDWWNTNGDYQMELIAAVETKLSERGVIVAAESDTPLELAASYLFVGILGALKPFVIATT